MFACNTSINLGDTDAAGVIYFARQYDIIHRAYEKLLAEIEFSIKYILDSSSFALPIIHSESDFILPITIGDEIEIQITLGRIGITSFMLDYELLKGGKLAGKASTVHVAIDKISKQKVQLPEDLVEKLKSIAG